MTLHPIFENLGAHSIETLPPAENKATSGFNLITSFKAIIVNFLLPKVIFLPTDFFEATGKNSFILILRSNKIFSIIWPTIPVTPTTAKRINKF